MSHAVREAGPGDLFPLVPLVEGFHAETDVQPSRPVAAVLDRLLRDPSVGRVGVVEDAERVIAYVAVGFGFSLEFGGRDGFVDELYVAPEARRSGIGRALLTWAIAEAEGAWSLGALHLEVDRRDQRARDFYAALGFETRTRYMLMSRRATRPEERNGKRP
ncbi:MAG: GNAT family N-acetyltransferase [Pseudomonadota bacterium]